MKRLSSVLMIGATLFLLSAGWLFAAPVEHEFGVKQYDDFHRVLHPLQHEALPKADFSRIRAKSSELIKHGRAIVKLGIPRGTKAAHVAEFRTELSKFNKALARFSSDVKKGSDEQLKVSYSAVHDSFEMLAAMLPR
ncbi:MAG: hypothetical protein JWM21_1565 [Acidobacteria bacterium]|nr:hypothetical protein [Acidobacteriota bacterium]